MISVISTMAAEAISKIIVGQMKVSDWDSVLADIEAAGYEKLMKLYDKSYQEYLKIIPQFKP
jgi:hypothetical protein